MEEGGSDHLRHTGVLSGNRVMTRQDSFWWASISGFYSPRVHQILSNRVSAEAGGTLQAPASADGINAALWHDLVALSSWKQEREHKSVMASLPLINCSKGWACSALLSEGSPSNATYFLCKLFYFLDFTHLILVDFLCTRILLQSMF